MDTDPPPSGFSQPHPCSLDAETHAKLCQNGDPLHEYKRLILQLGDALEDEKLKDKIRYLHKDKLGTVGEDTKALVLLRKLEEKGLFSARKLDALESLLRDIERCDLVESHLDPFRQKYGHQLSQAVTLQHSVSSPANTSSFPSRLQSAPLNRSTSFPVTAAVTSMTTMPSRELCSIEEENLIHRDPTSSIAAHGTHVSEKSLLVSGNFSSEIFSTLDQKMSGIGGASPHPPNSRHREDTLGRVGRQCIAELNNSPRYPLRRASLTQAGQELTPLKQANGGAGNSSVQVSNQAVLFEVGGLSSTLPHDCDSQLNFPMDNTTPSHSSTSAEVRSKSACRNLNNSLTEALTASLQQANERTRSNTPLPITTDKTPVEATDHGNGEACFVASEGKSHPPKAVPNTAGLPTVPETTREVNATITRHPTAPPPSATVTPAAANGAAALHHATASIECSTMSMPGRVWHSKPELFLLNREKMAIMISKQKTSHYHKRFNTTIPVSKSRKGVVHVSLEVFPYGRDADIETRHATVLAHVSYPHSSRKCKEMAENCNCIVKVKTTFLNVKTRDRLSSKEGKAELSPTSCEACVKISQALSHNDILYSKTNKIQMQVEATFRCQDKIVAVQSDDPDCKDYLLVTTNEP